MISSPLLRGPVLLLLLALLAAPARGALRGSVTTISAEKTGGNTLSQDWDARCPAQATALGHCVASSGGNLEICKGCARMAATLDSRELALEGCIEDQLMCHGCRNNLVAYYSCGSGDELEEAAYGDPHAETVTVHHSTNTNTNTINEPVDGMDSIAVHHLVHSQEHPSTNLNIPANQNNNVPAMQLVDTSTTTNNNGLTVHHLVHNQETSSSNLNIAANHHESPGHLPTGSLPDHATAATANTVANGGSTTHAWDLACPAHSYDLGNCVRNTPSGDPELCKTCAKMASTLNESEFVLDECASEPSMCNGCRNALQTYFDCGLHHDAGNGASSNGHAETVVVQEQEPSEETVVDFRPNTVTTSNANTNIDPATDNNNANANANNNNNQIADDWDAKCPVHAYDLQTCVAQKGGVLELCKSCAKMASTLGSSGFALDGCADDADMCAGCRTSLQGYFDCGVGAANSP